MKNRCTSKVACPDSHVTEGQAIVNPHPSDVDFLPAVLASPPQETSINLLTPLIQSSSYQAA
ncbi:hypothetical protein MAR_029173 [Mya arenaria]|uniref:Uncharacterized protein n=1 Tax=Mya arenaria TaxID=6604 RepID=A0ABY7DGS9_MYAAR|nr:hypothetical protein MAR_029173 [Mya arenaria]